MMEKVSTGVLIVAKCNVNLNGCITLCPRKIVLIVAKCNVNQNIQIYQKAYLDVLIVAKCNVNFYSNNRISIDWVY